MPKQSKNDNLQGRQGFCKKAVTKLLFLKCCEVTMIMPFFLLLDMTIGNLMCSVIHLHSLSHCFWEKQKVFIKPYNISPVGIQTAQICLSPSPSYLLKNGPDSMTGRVTNCLMLFVSPSTLPNTVMRCIVLFLALHEDQKRKVIFI